MKKESINKIIIVTLFAIAMGFLESTVVVYLRKLYYPNGFNFPLHGFVDPSILGIEWIREFATIVMLLAIGLLAGKKFYEKFSYFIYAFAVWDIFYYVFLKLILDWPCSLLAWDLLFLIPWPWIAPVLAPILCSILMIITAVLIINLEDSKTKMKVNIIEYIIIILGVLIVLFTFLYDYGKVIITNGFTKEFFTLVANEQFHKIITSYSPSKFNWILFLIGFIISVIGIIITYLKNKKRRKQK